MTTGDDILIQKQLNQEHTDHHAGRPFKPHRLMRSKARRASKRVLGRRPKDPAGIERGLTEAEKVLVRVRLGR